MLSKNFAAWMDSLKKSLVVSGVTDGDRGAQQELSRRSGIPSADLSRWKKTPQKANVGLDRFESIARRIRPNLPLYQVMREIEALPEYVQEPDPVAADNERVAETWNGLFEDNPRIATQTLFNVRDAKTLGLLDLVNRTARLIIDMGPNAAASHVSALLHSYPEELPTKELKRRRTIMSKEYESIGVAKPIIRRITDI